MTDAALECFVLVASYHGANFTVDALRSRFAIHEDRPLNTQHMVQLAEEVGFRATATRLSWRDLTKLGLAFPVCVKLRNGNYVIVAGVRPDQGGQLLVLVQDPQAESMDLIPVSKSAFKERWSGDTVLLRPADDGPQEANRFGFAWLARELTRYKGIVCEIFVISLVLHVIAFVVPIFTMIVFDKVVGYQGYATLHILFIAAIGAIAFHAALGLIRTFLLFHIVGKLDIAIADHASKKLLGLPLEFFQHSSAGVLTKKVQEASSIREFITGRLLLTCFEALAVVLIVPVLFLFSVPMTWIVCGFAALIAANVVLALRPHRRNLEALYEAEAKRQSMIVETITGIQTIKSMAIEQLQQKAWLSTTAQATLRLRSVGRLNGVISEISGFLQKAMHLTIIWFGAQLVLTEQMTIGALVAFNIMANRATAPLVQIVSIISKFQETGLSLRMLAGVLNERPERHRRGGITPSLSGQLSVERLCFSYGRNLPPVLDDVSFEIPAGARVGIVGPSGSGKSTLAKLLQGLCQPQSGYVRFDGYSVGEFDLAYLRSALGVVQQESFLFKGTVSDNIAIGYPQASREDVLQAARLAGAHGFIEALPQGYDTELEEQASNISGGQRQRICLARALLRNPRILIFDEATSNLDFESEQAILDKLDEIAEGRTLINITHRYSSMPRMSMILVIDEGKLIDLASHEVLLKRCDLYRRLWNKQFAVQSRRPISHAV